MSRFARTAALWLVVAALVSGPLTAAVNPFLYGASTAYGGTGKHPKTATTGVVIDGKAAGLKLICFDYFLFTDSKIKGQISGMAERITDQGIEKLGNFSKTKVQAVDFGDIPEDPEQDVCSPQVPDQEIDTNLGIANNCLEITQALAQGDIIRITLDVKKAAKLQGEGAGYFVSSSVLPFGPFVARRAEARSWRHLARELGIESVLDR